MVVITSISTGSPLTYHQLSTFQTSTGENVSVPADNLLVSINPRSSNYYIQMFYNISQDTTRFVVANSRYIIVPVLGSGSANVNYNNSLNQIILQFNGIDAQDNFQFYVYPKSNISFDFTA